MSANSLPQETVDEIVDFVVHGERDARTFSPLLLVSSKFRNRARYHVFKEVHLGNAMTSDHELKRRLKLFAGLISSSNSQPGPVKTLVRSLSVFTSQDIFIKTPRDLLYIIEALSGPNSQLVTVLLYCWSLIIHHRILIKSSLGTALATLAGAPRLLNFGTYNIPVGTWIYGSSIQRFYASFTAHDPEDRFPSEDCQVGNGGECLCVYPTSATDWNLDIRPSVFSSLTTVSITTSLLGPVFLLDEERKQPMMPRFEDVTVYVDTEGENILMPFLRESHETLRNLRIDFSLGAHYHNVNVNIIPFKALRRLRLRHVALESDDRPGEDATPAYFLEVVASVLEDDPSLPCPLETLSIDLGWLTVGNSRHACLYDVDHRSWEDLDNALVNLLRFNPSDPLKIKFVVRLGSWQTWDGRGVWFASDCERISDLVHLPQTMLTGRLSFDYPNMKYTGYYRERRPERDMELMLDERGDFSSDAYYF